MIDKVTMKINMTGKEYIEYRKSTKLFKRPLSKNTKKALPFFIMSFVCVMILAWLLSDITHTDPPPSRWQNVSASLKNPTWNNIAKLIVIVYAPMLVFFVGIAWIVHGFGFYIIR